MANSEDRSFDVHRFRIGNWLPAAVRSISVCPFSGRVAIGREDGDIEISDPNNKWYNIASISGHSGFKLNKLLWSTDPHEKGRLFGISLQGFVFEVDLTALTYKFIQDTYGGLPWSMAMSPRNAHIVIGCEDGTARLFSYENKRLDYVKGFATTGAKVLSVCYHPTKSQLFLGCADGTIRCVREDNGMALYRMTGDLMRGAITLISSLIVLSDSTVVTGDNRGHVQLWDGNTGVLMVSFHQHIAEVLALAVSPDERQIFASGIDSRVTCIRRLRNDGSEFDSIDNTTPPTQPTEGEWVYTTSHRPHSHDVFALAVCNNAQLNSTRNRQLAQKKGKKRRKSKANMDGGRNSIGSDSEGLAGESKNGEGDEDDSSDVMASKEPLLISGGLDCKVCAYSIQDFSNVRPIWILPVPARGIVSASTDHEVVALRHRNMVDVWHLELNNADNMISTLNTSTSPIAESKKDKKKKKKKRDSLSLPPPPAAVGGSVMSSPDSQCQLSLRINMASNEHISCMGVSPSGSLLVVCGQFGTKVYLLQRGYAADGAGEGDEEAPTQLQISATKLKIPRGARAPALGLAFSRDSNRLALLASSGKIMLIDVAYQYDTSEENKIKAKRDKKKKKKGEEGADAIKRVVDASLSLRHIFDHHDIVREHKEEDGTAEYDYSQMDPLLFAMRSASFSADGSYLSVQDCANNIYIYELDRWRLYWKPPINRGLGPLAASKFHPTDPYKLVMLYATGGFSILDLQNLNIEQRTREKEKNMYEFMRRLAGPLEGILFDERSEDSMLVYGQGVCTYVNMSMEVPKRPRHVLPTSSDAFDETEYSTLGRNKKRRKSMDAGPNFSSTTSYRSIIHLGVVDKQLVRICTSLSFYIFL
jgi:WD40 repeat protein